MTRPPQVHRRCEATMGINILKNEGNDTLKMFASWRTIECA